MHSSYVGGELVQLKLTEGAQEREMGGSGRR